MLIKGGIGASIFLFLLAGCCCVGALIGDHYNNWKVASIFNTGMISSFTLAIVVLILSIALHFSLEHSRANNTQKPNTIILIRNGEPIQIDPRELPYYLNSNPRRELPSGRQGQIQLDPASLEALASILERKNRYLPKENDEDKGEIMRF